MNNNKEYKIRIFPAVAGTAAAIGVLGAGVFGLNYMYQNGVEPLKENGGAAYHESEPQPGIKDIMTAAGDRFVFGDVVAEIENVDYDGQFIRVKYTVEYTGEDPEENVWRGLSLIVDPNYYNAPLINSHGSMRDLKALSDKKVEKIYAGDFVLDKDETVTFELFANSPDLFEETEVLAGTYTITGIDKSESCYSISDKITFNSDLYGETELYSVDISAYGVNLHHSMNFRIDNDFSFIVRYRDGSQFELYDYKIVDCSTSSSYDKDYAYSFLEIEKGDPIDVNDIAAVIINGTEIPLNCYAGMAQADAEDLLGQKNIGYEIIGTVTNEIPAGQVICTMPEFGLLDEQPEKVMLYVSEGSAVPDSEDELTVGSSFPLSEGTTATIASAQFDGFICKMVVDIHSDDPDYYKDVIYIAKNGVETSHLKVVTDRPEGASKTVLLSSDETGCTIRSIIHFLPTDDADGYPIVRKLVDCSGEHNRTAGYITIDLTEQQDTMLRTAVSGDETGDREIDISPLGYRIHQQNTDYELYPNGTATVTYKDGTVREIATYTGGWYSLVSDEQLLHGTFDEALDLTNVHSVELYDSTVIFD